MRSSEGLRYRKRSKLYYLGNQILRYQNNQTFLSQRASKIPQDVLDEFDENENFVSLERDPKFIDYQNAQIILIGAREGKDVIKRIVAYFTGQHCPRHI